MIDEKKLIQDLNDSIRIILKSDDRIKTVLHQIMRVIEEQPKVGEWIPFTVDDEGIFNCEIPKEDEEILISDKHSVWNDEFCFDIFESGYYLESGYEFCGLAWQPLPEPYKEEI